MTVYDNDLIPKAPRQYLLNVPTKGCKNQGHGGVQFSLHSGDGDLVRIRSYKLL